MGLFTKKEKNVITKNKKVSYKRNSNLIAYDMGASFHKLFSKGETRLSFYNGFQKFDVRCVNGDETVMTLNGETYIIGKTQNEEISDKSKKNYEITMLYGITDMIKKLGSKAHFNKDGSIDIELILLLPKDQIKNKDRFVNTLEKNTYNVTRYYDVETVDYKVNIHIGFFFSEGRSSYYCLNREIRKSIEQVYLINIGCSSTDTVLINCSNNSQVDDLVRYLGSRQLMEDVLEVLGSQGYEIEEAMYVEKLFINNDYRIRNNPEVDECIYLFTEKIIKQLRKIIQFLPKDTVILFCGGTSIIMKKQIEKFFKDNKDKYGHLQINFINDLDSKDDEIARFSDSKGAYMWALSKYALEQKKERELREKNIKTSKVKGVI